MVLSSFHMMLGDAIDQHIEQQKQHKGGCHPNGRLHQCLHQRFVALSFGK